MLPRTDKTGGIDAGVGRTALLIAAARSIETNRADSLAQDPLAEFLVRASPDTEGWPLRIEDVPGGDTNALWGRLGRYFGLRTRFLDDFLLQSVQAGNKQVVLLGAGLDSRAFRLEWPSDCTVYELDQSEVLRYKQRVFDSVDATPRCDRRQIAIDLHEDWPARLLAEGFLPTAPTAWLVEGLVFYLSPAAELRLFTAIHELTAPGSTLGYEIRILPEPPEVRNNAMYFTAKQQLGIDLQGLFVVDGRPEPVDEMNQRGWSTTVHTPFDLTRRYGRGPTPVQHDPLDHNRLILAYAPQRQSAD
ncbi:class I SAM-dependent methyltransferase [Actinoalloteichus hymeniacidonis]|uniref:S-adenosyl-L-methionine-dependent methyltransferase n=1 Tax=Actinoalloteichus hymeniacidonis TaxID=340345 RepID=A0AAC9HQM1_9PSEU|nr:class I SAM-dependent methyltransferase [Actinoalloteichus hymeniacidonis]AOS63822.1 methyltransferase, TIGR00027 family [Actinoalloteichus hymeniacidonis]MBB5908123.1 methyltransferase (TIGR00027 family) [Actinoalloteichus hymeniacidonis]